MKPIDTLMDARGRVIRLRSLDALSAMRVMRACPGNDPATLRLCARLARVASVDGREYPVPRRAETFVAVARHLGTDGLAALTRHLIEAQFDAGPSDGATG